MRDRRWPPARCRGPVLATSVLATSILALLAGCAPAPVGELPTDEVTVGTCKDRTTAEEMIALSDSSPAVPCTSPHTLETYALGTLDEEVSRSGPDRPAPEILVNAPGETCPLAPVRPYLGAGELDSQWGVSVFVKHPTRQEWTQGVRTVLCDLVVDAPPETVPRIDVPLRGIMAHPDSARVRLCASGEELLTCDRPHDAERVGPRPAQGDPTAVRAACEVTGRAYTGTEDLPAGVQAVARTISGADGCWLVTSGAATTGTLRGGLVPR